MEVTSEWSYLWDEFTYIFNCILHTKAKIIFTKYLRVYDLYSRNKVFNFSFLSFNNHVKKNTVLLQNGNVKTIRLKLWKKVSFAHMNSQKTVRCAGVDLSEVSIVKYSFTHTWNLPFMFDTSKWIHTLWVRSESTRTHKAVGSYCFQYPSN